MLFEAIAQLNQKYKKMPVGKTKKLVNYTTSYKAKSPTKAKQRKFAKSNTRRRRQAIKKSHATANNGSVATNGGF